MPKPKGRKIDTWTYEDRAAGTKFEIPVYMVKDCNGRVSFTAYLAIDAQTIEATGANLDEIKRDAFEQMKSVVNITWENKLYVAVHGNTLNLDGSEDDDLLDEKHCLIDVVMRPIKVGRQGDKTIWRGRDQYGRSTDGLPKVGHFSDSYNSGPPDATAILVDDTIGNRMAIEKMMRRATAFRDELMGMISPTDHVEFNTVDTD